MCILGAIIIYPMGVEKLTRISPLDPFQKNDVTIIPSWKQSRNLLADITVVSNKYRGRSENKLPPNPFYLTGPSPIAAHSSPPPPSPRRRSASTSPPPHPTVRGSPAAAAAGFASSPAGEAGQPSAQALRNARPLGVGSGPGRSLLPRNPRFRRPPARCDRAARGLPRCPYKERPLSPPRLSTQPLSRSRVCAAAASRTMRRTVVSDEEGTRFRC
jgi:hypothetical protein